MSVSVSRRDLSGSEDSAVSAVERVLIGANYPVDDLVFRRAEKYLTIESSGNYPFCRMKLSGSSLYIELCICDPVDIERLSAIPIYSELSRSSQKFTRFYINGPSDVEKFSDGLISAFCFINPSFRQRRTVSLPADGLPPKLAEFFKKMEAFSGSSKRYKITDGEISFFGAYIDGLSARGLDWAHIVPDRMSDGAIKVPGGRIKLQGRKTYMIYTRPERSLSTTSENLSLEEYIELQKHWFSDCLKNRDIYSL